MDPWLTELTRSKVPSGESKGGLEFEDDFKPYNRLPDSAEYLASLERKLRRLKGGNQKKDLVKSLEETHKSAIVRLMTEGDSSLQGDDLDAPVNSNFVLRKVAPDRQALTLGELVELLKADELAKVLEEENSNVQEELHKEDIGKTANPE